MNQIPNGNITVFLINEDNFTFYFVFIRDL